MNNRETIRRVTRCWRSGRPKPKAPAPAPDRPVARAPRPGGRTTRRLSLRWRFRRPVYACYATLETAKAPGRPRPLPIRDRRLFQRGVDRAELGVQVGAEAVDHSDDGERNAGCNEAVFDGGSAGLILHETRNQIFHR